MENTGSAEVGVPQEQCHLDCGSQWGPGATGLMQALTTKDLELGNCLRP